jgi:hypothetical protein
VIESGTPRCFDAGLRRASLPWLLGVQNPDLYPHLRWPAKTGRHGVGLGRSEAGPPLRQSAWFRSLSEMWVKIRVLNPKRHRSDSRKAEAFPKNVYASDSPEGHRGPPGTPRGAIRNARRCSSAFKLLDRQFTPILSGHSCAKQGKVYVHSLSVKAHPPDGPLHRVPIWHTVYFLWRRPYYAVAERC